MKMLGAGMALWLALAGTAAHAVRAEAAAARTIPEWDRTLHPERYRPPASAAD
jgi:hypothetical protein